MKKKGFTLIELLAVIIILAVIALIATPVVLNLLEKMRIKAAESSAKGYTKAVEYGIMNDGYFNNISFDGEYDVEDNELSISYQGDGPSKGVFTIEKNKVTYGEFCINGYPIKYENDIGKYAPGEISCNGEPVIKEPEGTELRELCKDSESMNKYDEITNFKIKKVEDLVCFSKSVNSGNTYEGKTIMLLSNIDIKDSNSYENSENTLYGDINENGVVEGLFTELTTGKGFKPIGNGSNTFKGTFDGYAYTLYNLYINRPSEIYVGLFGDTFGGIIKGVNVNNIEVIGGQYTGGIVGHLGGNSIVSEIAFYGKVTGTSNVGGITGYIRSATIDNVLVNADVTGTGYVGGINGYGKDSVNITAIMESGTVTSSNTVGKISGYRYNGTGYASTNVSKSSSQYAGNNGISYALNEHVMGLYDYVLDTYIGGDNDSSGYYFDYENEESTKIVVKSTELEPIKFNMQGEGTEESPYIIANAKDWKNATLKVKGGYYFKIDNDLDFENEKFYMLGTYNNQFDGVLLGNNNTISNVNISGYNSGIVGYLNGGTIKNLNIENSSSTATANNAGMLVGYNKNGFIEGINLKNITVKGTYNLGGIVGEMSSGGITGVNANNVTITGEQYTGGIVGQLINGTVKEIAFYGKVTGTSNVGGISGYVRSATIENVLVNADVTGTGYVGGINGYGKDSVNITAIMESGTVTSSNTVGKISGYRYNGTGYASTNVSKSSSQYAGNNGISYALNEHVMGLYDYVLDTYIGGDNDSSGYYFDYENEESTKIVVKSTELEPIKFNMQGEGTEESPYIIANAKDWKNATLKVKGGYYFKIDNDLDFENEKFYMLGTYNNQFDGVLLGNNNTISNVNISGYNSGIVGYLNGGTIKNLNIENSSSTATANNAGMLVGYNKNGFIEGINLKNITVKGTYNLGGIVGEMSSGGITGVNANNVTITGEQYTGGIVGQLINGTVKEIAFYGKVTGTSNVGGISGYVRSATIENVLVNADVTGTGYVGGINGYGKDSVNITAIMESGTVTSSNTAGKIAGYRYNGLGYASTIVKDSSSQYAGYDGTSYSSDDIQDLGYYATLKYSNIPIIESSITGDVNNTGYYFGYGNDGNIWVVKVGSAESGGNTNPTIEIDSNYTMTNIVGTTDTEAPTCELYYVVPVSNGIRASFSCTDNSGAPIVRSLFDSTTEKSAATFDTIGTLKSGSISGNTKIVISTWNVNNPISQPTPGTCYYFRYGGQDAEGNFSTYVTNICYRGFSE